MKKYLIPLMLFVFYTATLFAQNQQPLIEKFYLQTDRPLYLPGENVYYKTYIFDTYGLPSSIADQATIEVINPKGDVVLKESIKLNLGTGAGMFELNPSWAGGVYKIKMYDLWMRSHDSTYAFTKEFTLQKYVAPNLLITIDYEKKSFSKSEWAEADVTLTDAKNTKLAFHSFEYKIYSNGKVLLEKTAMTNGGGNSKLKFFIHENFDSDNTTIAIITAYRGQTESSFKKIPIAGASFDLQFLPEGGGMLADQDNTVAFRAVNTMGKPIELNGNIIDSKGSKVAEFASFHAGMGKFLLHPKSDEVYYAVGQLPSPYKVRLPPCSTMPKLEVISCNDDFCDIKIISPSSQYLTLKISDLHKVQVVQEIIAEDVNNFISLPIKNLKRGIHKISLLAGQLVVSERLVFLHKDRALQIAVITNKSQYELREKVQCTIKTTDHNGKPIPAEVSLAVINQKLLNYADDKQEHLTSQSLLCSELKGKIFEPNYYFDTLSRKSTAALDLVMLTHGWRQYNHDSLYQYAFKNFNFFNNLIVVRLTNHHQALKREVLVVANNDRALSMVSDEAGYLYLKKKNITRFTFFVQKINKNDDIRLEQLTYADFKKDRNRHLKNSEMKSSEIPVSKVLAKLDLPSSKFYEKEVELEDIIDYDGVLDEVVVVDLAIMKSKASLGYSATAVAGISINEISNTTMGNSITIKGSRSIPVLYYIDGIRVIPSSSIAYEDNYFGSFIEDDYDLMTSDHGITISNHKPSSFFYYNLQLPQPIYRNNATFYMPIYDGETKYNEERTDFRPTLYWNPHIYTNQHGEATVEFFTSDEITSFELYTEGISGSGLVGNKKHYISSNKLLNIQAKLPPYLVIGDSAAIDFVVYNESQEDAVIDFSIDYNPYIDVKYPSTFQKKIAPKSYLSMPVILKGNVAVKNTMLVARCSAGNRNDKLLIKTQVLNPYFDMSKTIAGLTSMQEKFEIQNLVPGSFQSKFTIYKDVAGKAMDGIENLLQEPHGCFEQVSSTTYPNAMVMQYLKIKGLPESSLANNAKSYLEHGYQKLKAYETSESGFSLYGNLPADIGLTAYGLIEFLEMKSAGVSIDQSLVDRTKEYILKKRNGKGGFVNNSQSYKTGSANDQVINAYVLRALSNIVPIHTVLQEYNTALQESLLKNDLYRLSLMAIAAHNFGKNEDYLLLSTSISTHLKDPSTFKSINSEATITRSYQNENNIETIAMALIALGKGPMPDLNLILNGIKYLLTKQSHGTFGATQATCLSIEAIITASRLIITTDQPKYLSAFLNNLEVYNNTTASYNAKLIDATIENKQYDFSIAIDEASKVNFQYNMGWYATKPQNSIEARLELTTQLMDKNIKLGDLTAMNIKIKNNKDSETLLPLVKIGIPAGLTYKIDQFKEWQESGKIDYFEIFENYVVLYLDKVDASAHEEYNLTLKAEAKGKYQAPASSVWPYYDSRNKYWVEGSEIKITQ